MASATPPASEGHMTAEQAEKYEDHFWGSNLEYDESRRATKYFAAQRVQDWNVRVREYFADKAAEEANREREKTEKETWQKELHRL
ncbi:Uu.00g032740.m01.CDS01 [Anthostomella pinea]|uniref:Uu.00g032740.m01.CDS01 n=1 Tax=Anthostomella pinea TaxID=933095 RepID=A0AAI8V8R0_9PEZI|nr:Uu.00g032740.m01.CDS01 [Anthostomella pinea]